MTFKHYKKENVLVKVAGEDQALQNFLTKQGFVYILTEDASPAPEASTEQPVAAPEETEEKPVAKRKLFGRKGKK